MGWLLPLFSLAVLLLSLFWLLPTPPSLVQPPALHGVPLDVPGPIVAAATRAVDLDGLTVIPLCASPHASKLQRRQLTLHTTSVHLPPIKLNIPIPFYPTRRLRILFTSSASEVVFNTLRIASSSFRAIDAGRQPMAVAVSGVSADFRGSFAVKLVARVEDTAPGVEEGQKQGIQVFKWAGSGRVDAKVEESALDLQLQLVEGKEKTSPRLEVLSSSVDEGVIERAELSGFGPWGKVVTRLL